MSRVFLALLASLVVAPLAAELVIRVVEPDPGVEILRNLDPYEVEGITLWRSQDPAVDAYREPACLEDLSRTVLLIVGDEVTLTTGEPQFAGNLGEQLQDVMGNTWCVVNAAFPGFSAAQKLGALKEQLERLKPVLVLWQVWEESPSLVGIGPHVYRLGDRATDTYGYPPMPVPDGLHQTLFQWSRLWEYAALSIAPRKAEYVVDTHREAIEVARRGNTTIMFATFPSLDTPLDQQERYRPPGQEDVVSWADAEGLHIVHVRGLLRNVDPQEIRLDDCCHYTRAGHEKIAERLGPILLSVAAPE